MGGDADGIGRRDAFVLVLVGEELVGGGGELPETGGLVTLEGGLATGGEFVKSAKRLQPAAAFWRR